MKLKQIFRGLLSLLIVAAGSLICVEIYFQVLYRYAEVLPSFMRLSNHLYIDPQGAPMLLPNSQLWHPAADGGGTNLVITNSSGFRGAEPISNPKLRILLLGDSVIFDGGLPLEDTTAVLLQEKLKKKYDTNKIDVLNLGVPNASINHHLAKLEHQALKFSPNIIVLGLYLNDMYTIPDINQWDVKQESKLILYSPYHLKTLINNFHLILKSSEDERFIWIDEFQSKDYASDQDKFNQLVQDAKYDWGGAWDHKNWMVIKEHLSKMKILANDSGAEFIVLLLPASPQIETDKSFKNYNQPQQIAEQITSELSIPFLDPLEQFRMSDQQVFYDQCHLSKHGAEVLASFLEVNLASSTAKIISRD